MLMSAHKCKHASLVLICIRFFEVVVSLSYLEPMLGPYLIPTLCAPTLVIHDYSLVSLVHIRLIEMHFITTNEEFVFSAKCCPSSRIAHPDVSSSAAASS